MQTDEQTLPVSVIIAAYNREQWVGEAVASAREQVPHPPAEVIVVDDGSSDGTAEAAQAAGARVIRHEHNQGAAAARNTGASASTQPWIAPLDSDDRWLPHMLATLWPLRGEYGFVSGAVLAVDGAGRPLRYGGTAGSQPLVLDSPAQIVFPENVVAASGVLVHRATFLESGGYRTTLRSAEDFDIWLRMLELRPGLCVPEVVMAYRRHATQKSGGFAYRDAVLAILEDYRTAPWFSDALLERQRTIMVWDDLREALENRAWRRALGAGGWIAGHPRRGRALLTALRRRRTARRRTLAYLA